MSCDNLNLDATIDSNSTTSEPLTLDSISRLLDSKLKSSFLEFSQVFRATLKQDIVDIVHREMNPVIQEIKNDFTNTTDFICEEQKYLKLQIEEKNKIIKNMESENIRLQASLSRIEDELAIMERNSRACNVEIQAVPESKNENVLMLFKKLCSVINFTVDDSSIRFCHRVAKMNHTSGRPRNILVGLSSTSQRDEILSAFYRFNKAHRNDRLGSTHLDINGEHQKIFVSEHLSPTLKMLYSESRKLTKSHNYKYVWVRFGKIFARRDDDSPAIWIKNHEILDKLQKP
ncbi:uncharacterized protein LOC123656081 [Melitaea cinxia]|uniref:uncharacterized protein LOC123656081 n=1 Tax=Melitaea cinxia TaxID=113334 RepID=UPI001E27295B|nr:uncharacterized protein LOC123656081 [Melitaea cinxia]